MAGAVATLIGEPGGAFLAGGTNLVDLMKLGAADGIQLTAEQIDKLNNLTPATGYHHNEEQTRMIDR
jgi:CO/xanthine dehydrogenase FAD-binding subunit